MSAQGNQDPQGASYAVISSSATTVVKNGPGVFLGIQGVNPGTTWTVTIYDNTAASGNQLCPATTTVTSGAVALGIPSGVGINFQNGLTIVTAGTAGTINVIYR